MPDNEGSERAQAFAQASAARRESGRVIVVFGTANGAGKTVVATNVAVGLAQRSRQPVCLIDLDVAKAGEATKALKVTPKRSLAELMPTLKRNPGGKLSALDEVAAPCSFGVHVVCCLSNPRQQSLLEPDLLASALRAVSSRYAYVIIDGGNAFSDPLMAAFDVANLMLLVVSPQMLLRYQTKWALGMLESLGFPAAMVKIVLNGALSSYDSAQGHRSLLPCEVLAGIPSDAASVNLSLSQQAPVVSARQHSQAAQALKRLAEVLISRNDLYLDAENIPRHIRRLEAPDGSAQGAALWCARLYTRESTGETEEPPDETMQLKRRLHERLVDELKLRQLDLAALTSSDHMIELRRKTEQVVTGLVARELESQTSSSEVRAHLVREVVEEVLGLGPLEELLADPQVTDILVNGKDEIYVERLGRLQLTAKRFLSNNQVLGVIERIIAPLGRRIDESSPMVDARLPDGSRINAIIPPLALNGPVLSIRKFARIRYTHEDLIGFGSLTPGMVQFIQACVRVRKNMIISGGAGSGKTTLLNVVSAFIPVGERIISIEDAAELKLAQPHWVSLEARLPSIEGKGQVAIRDLFRNALRMRPDRIIIGECRGAETLDMLQAMNTGHDGSLTTAHANSPHDLVSRLESMVLMSNVELPVRAIREMVASAIQLVLHTSRFPDGSRKITSISEIVDVVDGIEVLMQEIFMYKQTGVLPDGKVIGTFVPTGHLPTFLDELKVKGIELDESIFAAGNAQK